MSGPLHRQPLAAIAAAVAGGTVTAEAVVSASMAEVPRSDDGPGALNAFTSFGYEAALAEAREVDRRVAAGFRGALAGVPVAVKDNICTLDLPTTCASRMLAGYVSPYEATAVRRLRAAGAVVVGKTNLDEFGMGSSTEHSAFGPTRNPHDVTRVAGGSSGGSAAAVAAGLVPAALGSETGGSVRQPAAFCGIVGIKPSYGRVSRYGLVAFASSLDCIGTFGRTVADATRLLEAIAGPDPLDATTADRPVPGWEAELERGIAGLVIGLPREYFPAQLDPRIADRCRAAVARLEAAGATVREVSLPHTRYAIPTYYVLAPAEASANLARYDGVRYGRRAGAEHGVGAGHGPAAGSDAAADPVADLYRATRSLGFGGEVKRRIMLGTYALSAGYYEAYYARAQRVRALIAADFQAVFDAGVDLLFTPTTPTPAFRIGEKLDDPYEMYLADVFTVTANLAAIPALSLPIGTVDGLPVGGQLLAPRWQEATLVRAAAALERELGA
jgi:aspartyl-tRNA(Asn)/glutamyl-tRNA(Gln) amidotransferase subunit A